MLLIYSIILSPNPSSKNPTNSQISQRTTDENKTSKLSTITILLDSSDNVLFVREHFLHE